MTLIVAHRGSHDIHRENSVAAFRDAVTRGADGIELDLRRSRDGVGVIHHDAALADGRVIAETLAADLGADVCTLGDALDACAGAFVNIEIKTNSASRATIPTREWLRCSPLSSSAGPMHHRAG